MTRSVRRLRLLARQAQIPGCCDALLAFAPPDRDANLIRLGLSEALSNAVIHGALGVPSSLRGAGEEAYLEAIEAAEASAPNDLAVEIDVRTAPNVVEFVIRDPGRGFDWTREWDRDRSGLSLMFLVFDEVRWSSRGTQVHLRLERRP